ncbi:hypothetical protein SDC9_184889 [bioreactor metagenome]|uniref:Uncharacterized protein n=1 Tax=bioreactor metagenome TaxID=1076179 RepID=A0A645HG64_9ZZZZ
MGEGVKFVQQPLQFVERLQRGLEHRGRLGKPPPIGGEGRGQLGKPPEIRVPLPGIRVKQAQIPGHLFRDIAPFGNFMAHDATSYLAGETNFFGN